MKLSMYQIDTFTDEVFKGNPAAVCPLEYWLEDEILQNIANENNLSETAFFVKEDDKYRIRWFTPITEVDLCGHATLATAHVIFNTQKIDSSKISFYSKSGLLTVNRNNEGYTLDFPVLPAKISETPSLMSEAFDKEPIEVWKSDDYMAIFETENDVLTLSPDFNLLKSLDCRGIIVTSKGSESDFVSRFFAPNCGVNEDPVTGSAHCMLTPYWAKKLNKTSLTAKQLSKRGGKLECKLINDRVLISGYTKKYLEGTIYI